MIKADKNLKSSSKFPAHEWVWENIETIINKYAGGFIIAVDAHKGYLLYTDADGNPRELMKKAKKRYPRSKPFFFRVPQKHEFICVLTMS